VPTKSFAASNSLPSFPNPP